MTLLIKNGTIVNADSNLKADLLIEDGKIVKIGNNLKLDSTSEKTIDASACYVIPGGIDPHVHMHLPSPAGYSSDDFLTGSKAALYGGTTTILDFVTPHKGQLLADAIELRKEEAKNCLTDISFHVSPIEWRGSMAEEIADCIDNEGFTSFKVYMAYKDSIGINDNVLLKVMKAVGKAGGMVMVHCELGNEIEKLRNDFASHNKLSPTYHPLSRPARVEAQAVKKAIELAKEAVCPLYIVHVSAKESLLYISEAQKSGQRVFAETCPQYLLLNDAMYDGDFVDVVPYIMSPPLREKEDNEALWQALSNGTIQTIGTDHCPFTLAQKEFGKSDFRKIPNGAGGVEHRLSLIYTYGVLTGRITLNQFVALTSTNAARIFGLLPAKGIIAEGSDADIVVWDPKAESIISTKTHHQNCDLNIYEGVKTNGAPKFVIKGGNIVIKNGEAVNKMTYGKVLKTNPL